MELNLEYLSKKYKPSQQRCLLDLNTPILSHYCRLETQEAIAEQEKAMGGKFVREHQLIAAAASTSFKAPLYVREAL